MKGKTMKLKRKQNNTFVTLSDERPQKYKQHEEIMMALTPSKLRACYSTKTGRKCLLYLKKGFNIQCMQNSVKIPQKRQEMQLKIQETKQTIHRR